MLILNRFSRVRLCVILWTVAHEALMAVGFSRQEYWSGLPCPPSGGLPDPGIEPTPLTSPASAGRFFTTSTPLGSRQNISSHYQMSLLGANPSIKNIVMHHINKGKRQMIITIDTQKTFDKSNTHS